MPIHKVTLAKYVNPTFVETGTYHSEAVDLAKELGFGVIHTMDVNRDFVEAARRRLVNAYCGDSPSILSEILPTISGPITFWLDAHPLETPMPLFDPRFPLLRELFAIKRRAYRGAHVILVDDLRTFSVEDLANLGTVVQAFWPDAKIGRENGIQADDILVVDMR